MRLLLRTYWYLSYVCRKFLFRLSSNKQELNTFRKLLGSQASSPALPPITALAHELTTDKRTITYPDFGAGKHDKGPGQVTRTVGELARLSSRAPQEGVLLHQLLQYLKPRIALELGTHLGIGSLYQASAAPACRFITLEGAEELGQIARENWKRIGLAPLPELHIGQFDEVLPGILETGLQPDYALIDGNHRYEPTIRYFNWIFDRMEEGGVIVLDDIYWSSGMKRAWDHIRKRQGLSLAIDIHQFGIIQKGTGSSKTWYL